MRRTLKDRGVNPADDRPLFVNANDRPLTRFALGHIVLVRRCRGAITAPSLAFPAFATAQCRKSA